MALNRIKQPHIETNLEDPSISCVYTTFTCRICSNAFIDKDDLNIQNISPKYKACPECVKKGNKYEDNKVQKVKDLKIDNIYSYVSSNVEWTHQAFILNKSLEILDKGSKNMRADGIVKQASEILNYYLEDKDDSWKEIELKWI